VIYTYKVGKKLGSRGLKNVLGNLQPLLQLPSDGTEMLFMLLLSPLLLLLLSTSQSLQYSCSFVTRSQSSIYQLLKDSIHIGVTFTRQMPSASQWQCFLRNSLQRSRVSTPRRRLAHRKQNLQNYWATLFNYIIIEITGSKLNKIEKEGFVLSGLQAQI